MKRPFQFAITTDFVSDSGSPESALRQIAECGVKWVHWCHHWSDDYRYEEQDLRQLEGWLHETGLGIHDIHGSAGRQTAWDSVLEDERRAGVDLVRNRLEMAARFGCEVVIMHPARLKDGATDTPTRWESLLRSIDALQSDLSRLNVRLAIENMAAPESFDQLDRIMCTFPPDRVGICYDSGHGCIAGNGLDRLERHPDRLIATHLNDNDGKRDLHQPLFMGRVDRMRLASIIRDSSYDREAMSVEVSVRHSGIVDEQEFLLQTLHGVSRFGAMVLQTDELQRAINQAI